jgi:hypothetical protein
MAANLAALNNYLQNTLLIQDQDVRVALNQQGLQAFGEFTDLTDDDIKDICKNVRNPGGLVVDPNAAAGAGALVPNRGVTLGHVFEKRLRQLRYYCFHLHRIQRDFAPGQATLQRLSQCWKLKEEEDEAEEVPDPEPLTNITKVRQTLENIDDVLHRKRGAYGIPLTYVVRSDVQLPENIDGQNDPGYGHPSLMEEAIRRTRHTGQYYTQDNKAVWAIIRTVMHGGPGWSWVQPYARTQDGRGAYEAIKAHYLGESFQSRTKAEADKILDTAFYDGRARNFTFERFCEKLQTAFADLEENGEEFPDTRKVRKLLQAIRDPALEHAKAAVLANPDLKSSFDRAMNYIAEFATEQESLRAKSRNISQVNTRGPGGGRGRGGPGRGRGRQGGRGRGGRGGRTVRVSFDSNNPDRYYSPQEWRSLTPEQQQLVRDARQRKKRQVSALETNPAEEPPTAAARTEDRNTSVGASMTRRQAGSRE